MSYNVPSKSKMTALVFIEDRWPRILEYSSQAANSFVGFLAEAVDLNFARNTGIRYYRFSYPHCNERNFRFSEEFVYACAGTVG